MRVVAGTAAMLAVGGEPSQPGEQEGMKGMQRTGGVVALLMNVPSFTTELTMAEVPTLAGQEEAVVMDMAARANMAGVIRGGLITTADQLSTKVILAVLISAEAKKVGASLSIGGARAAAEAVRLAASV